MILSSKRLKLTILGLLGGLTTVLGAAAANRPNILWIFSEDLH